MADDNALIISLDTKTAVENVKSLTGFVKDFGKALSSLPKGLPKQLTTSIQSVTKEVSSLKSSTSGLQDASRAVSSFTTSINSIGGGTKGISTLSTTLKSLGGGLKQLLRSISGIGDDTGAKFSTFITDLNKAFGTLDLQNIYKVTYALNRLANSIQMLKSVAPTLGNQIKGVNKIIEGFSGETEKASKGLNLFSGGWRSFITAMAGSSIIFLLVNGFKTLVKSAMDFDFMLRRINTMARQSEAGLGKMANTMLDISGKYGIAKQDITEAMYAITSATIKGAGALDVLNASAEFAVVGATDMKSSAELISRVIMAYGKSAYAAGEVTDTMFKTIERGITTAEELNHDLGKVLATAAAAKVSFEDIGAAVATLTARGLQTNIAVTSLNALLLKLNSNTKKLNPVFQRLGYESSSAALQQLGLAKTMQIVEQATGGAVDGLIRLGFNYRDVRAATILANDASDVYKKNLQEIVEAQRPSGASTIALKEVQKSFAQQLNELSGSLENVGLKLVNFFGTFSGIRYIIGLISTIKNAAREGSAFAQVIVGTASALGSLMSIVGGVTLSLGVLVGAIYAVKGVLATIPLILKGISTSITLVKTAIIATKAAIAITAPEIIVITAALAGIVAVATAVTYKMNTFNRSLASGTVSKATKEFEAFNKVFGSPKTGLSRTFALAEIQSTLDKLAEQKKILGDGNKELNKSIKLYTDLYEKVNNTTSALEDNNAAIADFHEQLEVIKKDNLIASLGDWGVLLQLKQDLKELSDELSNLEEGSVAFAQTQVEIAKLETKLESATRKAEDFNKALVKAFSQIGKKQTLNDYIDNWNTLATKLPEQFKEFLSPEFLYGLDKKQIEGLVSDVRQSFEKELARGTLETDALNRLSLSENISKMGISGVSISDLVGKDLNAVSEGMNSTTQALTTFNNAAKDTGSTIIDVAGYYENLYKQASKLGTALGDTTLTKNMQKNAEINRAIISAYSELSLEAPISVSKTTFSDKAMKEEMRDWQNKLDALGEVIGASFDASDFVDISRNWDTYEKTLSINKEKLQSALMQQLQLDTGGLQGVQSSLVENMAVKQTKEQEEVLKSLIDIASTFKNIRAELDAGAFDFAPKSKQVQILKNDLKGLLGVYKDLVSSGNIPAANIAKLKAMGVAKQLEGLISSSAQSNLTSSTVTAVEVGSKAAFDIVAKTSKQDYIETISDNVSGILGVAKGIFREQLKNRQSASEIII